MPLQTPSEPKRYTTVYSDFRGVDFTNDQTKEKPYRIKYDS